MFIGSLFCTSLIITVSLSVLNLINLESSLSSKILKSNEANSNNQKEMEKVVS